MDKYFKNLILCGDTDYYCLICSEYFQSIVDIDKHIRWENHRKLLKNQKCIPKFQKDFIHKVNEERYYCQVCNLLLPTLPEVTVHINEESHKNNKTNPLLDKEKKIECKYDSGFVIISDFIVSSEDWHCILRAKCLLCEINVINVKQHVKFTGHVFKIIRNKLLNRGENEYYRKIDDETFFCYVCKNIITLESFETHWSEKDHLSNKSDTINRVTAISKDKEDKKLEFIKKLIESQREHYDIDMEANTATCKDCNLKVSIDFKTLVMHQKSHGTKENRTKPISAAVPEESSDEEEPIVVFQEVTDYGQRRSDCAKYGRKHLIRLNAGGGRGYCGLCHVSLSASIKVFKEHIKGVRHRSYLELKGIKKCREHAVPSFRSKSLMEYLKTIYYSQSLKVLYINKKMCIEMHSFLLICRDLIDPQCNKTKCFVCDVLFPAGENEKHYRTEMHKQKFLAVKVLEIEGEFIREIRRNVFHCGVCNEIYPFWELMDRHLNSQAHLYKIGNFNFSNKIVQQWYTEDIPGQSSGHPDVLYMQLMGLGIFD